MKKKLIRNIILVIFISIVMYSLIATRPKNITIEVWHNENRERFFNLSLFLICKLIKRWEGISNTFLPFLIIIFTTYNTIK